MEKELFLKTQYEIRYFQLLNLYLSNSISVPEAYLYALKYKIYPIFHIEGNFGVSSIEELEKKDPYASLYDIDYFKVTRIANDLDSRYTSKNYQTFYEMIDSNTDISRDKIYNVLRYFKLSDRFEDEMYRKIASNSPSEYRNIDKDIKDYELSVFI